MARVLMPLACGFEEIEAVAVIDVLRRGGVQVVTASTDGEYEVRGAHGIVMRADALLTEVESFDFEAIVLLGGGEGTENLKRSEAVIARLRRQKEDGGLLCAICAAPLVLVEAGVLEDGQCVTCYPTCQMDLDRPWSEQPVVVHDNVITSQAPGTALLFALVLLQTLTTEAVARRVARGMVAEF